MHQAARTEKAYLLLGLMTLAVFQFFCYIFNIHPQKTQGGEVPEFYEECVVDCIVSFNFLYGMGGRCGCAEYAL